MLTKITHSLSAKFVEKSPNRDYDYAASFYDTGSKLPPVSIMGTISGYLHLTVKVKEKMYQYIKSTTQRCPNKIIKTFLIEDFFHLPQMSATGAVHLEL